MSDDAWTWGEEMVSGDSAKGSFTYQLIMNMMLVSILGIDGLTATWLHVGRQNFAGAEK